MTSRIDSALCESMARRGAEGDVQARQNLIEYLWPHWLTLIRFSPRMASLGKSDDDVYNVATQLVAKLGDKQARALVSFVSWQASHHDQDFGDWIRIVTSNAVRSYVLQRRGSHPPKESVPSVTGVINEYTRGADGVRPPMTLAQTARELIDYAKLRLPANQVETLSLWLEGGSFEEIETKLGLSAGKGKRLLKAAIAVLRRHFNDTINEIDIDPA